MARDPDTIQREIDTARDALATSLDVLADRADPRKLVDAGKASVTGTLNRPAVRYGLYAAGAVLGLAVLRALFR